MPYLLKRWWCKRQIAMCSYRREELHMIFLREASAIDADEERFNRRLRELESSRLHERLSVQRI